MEINLKIDHNTLKWTLVRNEPKNIEMKINLEMNR